MTTEADHETVAALRAGDERTFAALVDRYSPVMRSVARSYVSTHEVAEDVVQETWLAVLKGIDGFEARSSLRTWLFRILVNIAKTRGIRERRAVSFEVSTVDPSRFRPAGDDWPRHWLTPPEQWHESPERSVLSGEAVALVRRELDELPDAQRRVVALRDVEGYGADEVCELLHLTPANQRVLLHRGRARIRTALAGYFGVVAT